MPHSRRRVLQSLAALAALPIASRATLAARIVIVGGGWAGMSAIASLHRLAPELELTLIEPQTRFFSLPLSNKWLAGHLAEASLWRDYAVAMKRHACRHLQVAASAIDRERREVHTPAGRIGYDWLLLATGIRHDWSAWCADEASAALAASRYGPAWQTGAEVGALKQKLDTFAGGELLMAIAPGPARCPPAPFERASAIAHLLKTRGIKGRLTLLDPGPGILGFRQLFAQRYADQIMHVTHATVTSVDPGAKIVHTEFDDYRFDEAILMPPQQAHELVRKAGLEMTSAAGKPLGWAAQHALHLQAQNDDRIFLAGDLLGPVSTLFGHYPKTADIARQLGHIAALQIMARVRNQPPPLHLPASVCHITSDFALPEGIRIDASHRQRGDGVITQSARQQRQPQPRGEDEAWLTDALAELF